MKLRPVRIEGDLAYVPLTRGFEAIIDAADAETAGRFNWYALVTKTGHTYALRALKKGGDEEARLLHRLIMSAPAGMDVDHINGNGLDNRRANLRVCTHAQNMANQRIERMNSLGYRGVYQKSRRSFRAEISVMDRKVHLGCYPTPEEAGAAYERAVRELRGEYAIREAPAVSDEG